MKQVRQWQRICILSLLTVSVFAPIVLVSHRLKALTSTGRREFIEDLSTIKFRTDGLKLNAIQQEDGKGLREPKLVIYKDKEFNSVDGVNTSSENLDSNLPRSYEDLNVSVIKSVSEIYLEEKEKSEKSQQKTILRSDEKEQYSQRSVQPDQNKRSPLHTDDKIKEMKDQLIRAKAYVNFAPPGSNAHLVKELRTRIKELERAAGVASRDSDLSRSVLQKIKSMEVSLSKASQIFDDCPAMATKLRAMTYNAEEQVRAQKNQVTYLVQLAARTTPKGLHCLSMRLTAEYFALQPEERQLPNQQKLHDPSLYHYAVFSDNVLACAVVINSTVTFATEPEKIVFHVVTDSLNLPAISMWFLVNPPGKATIQIESTDSFDWLSSKYNATLKKQNSHDVRFNSALNHLRFYLPDVFPELDKIVLFDHDVVVQRDLSRLWSINMKGKVNAAVETCQEGEASFRRMDMFINFSDTLVPKKFDAKACTWAFGMNLFDLQVWRRRNLTSVYHKYLQLGYKRPLWKAGSLPLGWVTFYNQTVALNKRWHLLGLGYDSGVGRGDIERAAVIHYDGVMKPWLDIGIAKYKGYWSKHVDYHNPYLLQCNIHE